MLPTGFLTADSDPLYKTPRLHCAGFSFCHPAPLLTPGRCTFALAKRAPPLYNSRMQTRVTVPLEDFPEEGLRLQGEADGAIFDIDNTGARSVSPLEYDLEAKLYDTELLITGNVYATFSLRCDRCLEEFDYEVEIEDLALSYDTKGKFEIDLTQDLREEVLLELPGYPKCEISGLKCKINDTIGDFRLDKDPQSGVESPTPSGQSVWDALDQFPSK